MRISTDEAIKKLEETMRVTYSEEQLEIIKHPGGMCILSCAGSGKTFTLASLTAKRFLTGEITNASRVLMTTYSKAGAGELENKINSCLSNLGIRNKVKASTIHSTYWHILKHFNLMRPLCSSGQRTYYISKVCKELKLGMSDEDIESVDSIMAFQINYMFSDEQVYKSYAFNIEISLEQYKLIRSGYAKKKAEANQMDFDDMQYYMYYYLCYEKNPDFIAYCKGLWDYFFIDEFQDTSRIQFEILKVLVTDPEKLIVIGDDDQCIYSWRGADPSIIQNICAYYDISKFMLTTNYRCSENILNYASSGVKYMSKREEKDMKPCKPDGKVSFIDCKANNLLEMSKLAYNYIVDCIEVKKISPENLCILVRNNAHAMIVINMLITHNYYCKYVDSMKMSKSPYYKDMRDITSLIGSDLEMPTFDPNVVKNLLWKLVPYLSTACANEVANLMRETCSNIVSVLTYILQNYCGKCLDVTSKLRVDKTADLRARARLSRLNAEVVNNLMGLRTLLMSDSLDEKFKKAVQLYYEGMQFTLASDENKARVFSGFINYYSEIFVNEGLDRLKDVLRFTETYDESDMDFYYESVNISTIHGAKGLEWSRVVVLAYDNISFPSFKSIYTSRDRGVSETDIEEYIDGERRLAYVAMTRAVNELVNIGDFNNFSVFGLEAIGKFNESTPKEIIETAVNYMRYHRIPDKMKIDKEIDMENELSCYKYK